MLLARMSEDASLLDSSSNTLSASTRYNHQRQGKKRQCDSNSESHSIQGGRIPKGSSQVKLSNMPETPNKPANPVEELVKPCSDTGMAKQTMYYRTRCRVVRVFLSLALVGYNVYYCEVWAAVWLYWDWASLSTSFFAAPRDVVKTCRAFTWGEGIRNRSKHMQQPQLME
jgi:hypothetical protein